jgi:DICT domain-containing protein
MSAALELAQIIKLVAATHKHANANFENKSQSALIEGLGSDKLFFTSSVLGMKAISRVIEDRALGAKPPSRLFSGFQYLSRFTPQAQRYHRILEAGCPVYIYGVPDALIEQKDNLRIIRLEEVSSLEQEEPALSQFWFVVLDNPQQVSMALFGSI